MFQNLRIFIITFDENFNNKNLSDFEGILRYCPNVRHVLRVSMSSQLTYFLELEREKLKHSDYMEKSDEFVNLLETDRQKLKLALEKEKALNDGQVRQYEKLKRETSEEIDKLKKFSMLLVEEKQSAMKREERHNERIKARM